MASIVLNNWAQYLCAFFCQKLTNCTSLISGRKKMIIENISRSIYTKECCWIQRGSKSHLTESLRPYFKKLHKKQNLGQTGNVFL